MHSKMKAAAFIAVGLVAGLVLGGIGIASAATAVAPKASTGPTVTPGSGACGTGGGLRMGGFMRDSGGRLPDVVAKLTGLDVDDVIAKRQAGESFEAIAKTKGVSADEVVAEALKVRTEAVNEAVKDGRITAEQATTMLANMEDRLTASVEATGVPARGGRGGRGGGMGGGCGGRFGGQGTTAPSSGSTQSGLSL